MDEQYYMGLFCAKPLPEPVETYCLLDPMNKHQWNWYRNTQVSIHKNAFENVVC